MLSSHGAIPPVLEDSQRFPVVRRTCNKDVNGCHVSYGLNSLRGGYIGDYIGDYYRGY